MDIFLVDYLRSGRAWVLVGSGPSIEMGYPSWEKLASHAVSTVKTEKPGHPMSVLRPAMEHKDFPKVFDEAKACLGAPRLLQSLQEKLTPTGLGDIYKLIARWPVPVYLTTNYDDEIQKQLAELGEAYVPYSNSEDHMAHLIPDLNGAIFKLHGDLRSEIGLILTTSQYREIAEADSWKYWRTKMTSVFQMNRLVVIGHSLTDKNIRHVLEAAKQGAGVVQPICWIAPDVSSDRAREFLEKHRIRVISYDNQDGEHRNLVRLIENVSEFVPPRTAVRIKESIARVLHSPLESSAGAPGFFVFNKLLQQSDYDEKRLDILIAAIQSAIPKLRSSEKFAIQEALEIAGWPADYPLPISLSEGVGMRALTQGLFERVGDDFRVTKKAETLAAESKAGFEHVRNRFLESLRLRLQRAYPALTGDVAAKISADIEASLTGYFREGGLTLATTLFSSGGLRRVGGVPKSILKFISEASARYDSLLHRQAFVSESVDAFVDAGTAEREYLGRISQGFFGFHALGVFGDTAKERLNHSRETVWLIDSDAQIQALALAAPTNTVFRECFLRLRAAGIRTFTTEKLFHETREHLRFGDNVIRVNGSASRAVIAAAMGQAPYRKSNQFLGGFIRWQHAGNPRDWDRYKFKIFGIQNPGAEDVKRALGEIGIEVVAFQDWPGVKSADFEILDEYVARIAEAREGKSPSREEDRLSDFYRKAGPEGEALLIVKREREGTYYIMSREGASSTSWFISQTSILNAIEPRSRITWQPDGFLRFTETLAPVADYATGDRAFEALLWGLAQSGLNVLAHKDVEGAMGGVIDEAQLAIAELRQEYTQTIEQKYGESLESVLNRVPPIYRPLAAVQLANEITQKIEAKRVQAEKELATERTRADRAERMLTEVEKFRRKMEAKHHRGRQKARKQRARGERKK